MEFVVRFWRVLVCVLGLLVWVLGVVFGEFGVVLFFPFFLSFFFLLLGGIEGVQGSVGVRSGTSSGVGGVRFGAHLVGVGLRAVAW